MEFVQKGLKKIKILRGEKNSFEKLDINSDKDFRKECSPFREC